MPTLLHRFTHGDHERVYRLHVPEDPGALVRPLALVLVLHGGGGDGARIAEITGFDTVADAAGFLVAYPDGVERAWSDGRNTSIHTPGVGRVDDVGFLTEVIRRVSEAYPVEARRVYIAGASNGAMMAHRFACENSDAVAAIAAVMGSIPENLYAAWKPARPVSAIVINGLSDPIVPWSGGEVRVGGKTHGRVVPVEDSAAFWVRHNGCSTDAESVWLPETGDGTRVWRKTFTGGKQGTEVALYGIIEGGHTWPGGKQYLAEWIVGKTSRAFGATQAIWEFFREHPRP